MTTDSGLQADIDGEVNMMTDDGPKVFEKICGPMMMVSNKHDEWVDTTSKDYIDSKIDVMGSSPGERYVATW
ncbi:14543_t:CDS:1, partial [Acaulospora morrowiae]